MINLDTAWKVYLVINKYLPTSISETETDVDYFMKIVDNVIEHEGYTDLIHATSLMSGLPLEELVKMEVDDIIELFTIGIRENKVMEMKLFFDRFRGT